LVFKGIWTDKKIEKELKILKEEIRKGNMPR
jgi:hypothetical protein